SQLVAQSDLLEELRQERVELLRLCGGALEARRIEEVGFLERAQRGDERVEARVVRGAQERVPHCAEVGQELADELKRRGPAPPIHAARRRTGLRAKRAGDLREHPDVAPQSTRERASRGGV